MKKFLVFVATLFLFACGTQESKEVVSTATVSGTITAPKGEKVKLSNGSNKMEAIIKDGKFVINVNLTEADNYLFRYDSDATEIYLEPGDNITMTFSTDDFGESLVYAGKGGIVNNYLAKSYQLNEKEMGDFAELYKSDETTFVAKVADLKSKMDAHLSEAQKEHPEMNKTFLAKQKVNLLYDWANHRSRYEEYHQYLSKNKEFKVSDSYNDYKKGLDLENADFLSSSNYKTYVVAHYDAIAKQIMEADKVLKDDASSGWLKAQMTAFDAHVKNPSIKSYLNFDALKNQISFVGTDGIASILENFKQTSDNNKQKTELQELWDKWAVLAAGEIAPGFEYADIEGSKIALEDFRGKHVYIDVWATWCGPCLRELPHLEKLQEKYHDNENIVFASVSIDEDKEAWENMVKKKEMQGVQLIGDEAWNSSICKDYLIRGIPRFILVDEAGKIMNARAPRPSSDEIKDILKEMAHPTLTSMK